MPGPASRVVVWDLGNVLIPWDRHGALLAATGDDRRARELAEQVFTLEVNEHLDRGLPLQEVRAVVEADHPELGWVVEAYVEHFARSLGPVIEGSVQLLGEVSGAGHRCVGLSNWSSITFAGVPEAYPALGGLEGVLISGEVGVTKPDPSIFALCADRFGFDAHQAVFIDDSPTNVAAAELLGWDTIQFSTPELLRAELASRDLLA